MTRANKFAAVAAIALFGPPAGALARQPPPLHTVDWYARNTSEREATLRWCHDSSDRPGLYDCQNAEAAGNASRLRGGDPLAVLDSPAYWAANPIARNMVRNICANPSSPGAAMYLRYCGVAR